MRSQATVALLVISSWASERVLHNFGSGTDGQNAQSSLILDASPDLYGTTYAGGSHGLGIVFETSPNGSGGWTESVLHSFGQGLDGSTPAGVGQVLDGSGNLYGTTSAGGSHDEGTVFELTP